MKIMTENEIDLSKCVWQFWQGMMSYDYGDNECICLYNVSTNLVELSSGRPLSGDGSKDVAYVVGGVFSLYKKFKMSNGKEGVDKTRPQKTISVSQNCEGKGEKPLIKRALVELYNLYQNSLK